MRKLSLALPLLAAFLPLIGCGQNKQDTGTSNAKSKGIIGVSVLTLTNPFFKVIGDTITEDAGKLGYEVVVVSGDDVARQRNQVKDFLVKKARAIVLCP